MCVDCPRGQYCPSDFTLQPLNCTPGTYAANMGSSECTQCSAGQYSGVEGTVTSCTECPGGSLCNDTAIESQCPATTFSTAGSTACTECSAGYFTASPGNSACTECSPGNYCVNGALTPCDPGYYAANSGQSACTECAAGYFCAGAGTAPQPCDAGEYSVALSSACQNCTAGSSCATPFDAPAPCDNGTVSAARATACSSCTEGWYADAPGLTECTQCAAGYYCPSTASGPIRCPNHTISTVGALSCTGCASGQFQNVSAPSQCIACEAGYACTSDAVQVCPVGTASAGGAAECGTCPEGTFTDTTGSTACLSCPAGYQCSDPSQAVPCDDGYYSNTAGSVECEPCPPGLTCPDGAHAVPCLLGTYSLVGDASCDSCPSGFSCPSPSVLPTACPSGQYSLAGDWACHECPTGFSCSVDADIAPTECAAGTYSEAGQMECKTCVEGHACPVAAAGSMVSCPAGFYADSGASSCSPCPANHYCPVSTSAPILCPEGMFSTRGASTCTVCPAGYRCESSTDPENITKTVCSSGYFSALGSSGCSQCQKGAYCPEGASAPILCAPGYYQNRRARSVCKECPTGSECPGGGDDHVPCVDGHFSLGRQRSCTSCPVGHECPLTTAEPEACAAGTYSIGNQTACSECSVGHYCPDTTAAIMLPCPWGKYQSSSNAYACALCPVDYSCTAASVTSCATGEHSPKGEMDCTPCPGGYMCGGPYAQDREPCAAGEASAEGTDTCSDCAAGQFSNAGAATCEPCPDGTYSADGAGYCLECPAGYACVSGDNAEPDMCGFGYFSTAGASECSECFDGSFCPPGSTSASPRPQTVDCEVGYVCDNSVDATSQWSSAASPNFDTLTSSEPSPCPVGTYGVYAGAPNATVGCHPCPAGTYCPVEASTLEMAIPCPRGFYCPAGSDEPTPCELRSYSFMEGARNSSQCTLCPKGHFCRVPTDFQAASAGDFSMIPHRGGQGIYCPEGRNCYACPAGTYSGGEVNDASGAAYGSLRETALLYSLRQCLNCTAGHYCPERSHVPTACAAGKYQPYMGAFDVENCLPCDPGYACPETGSTASDHVVCSPGHYCPPGTVNPDDFPCPAGKYSDSVTLFHEGFRLYKSDGDCKICPPFFACPEGTGGLPIDYEDSSLPVGFDTAFGLRSGVEMIPCEPGYYCPPGTTFSTEFPCPAGKYSDSDHIRDAEECVLCPAGFTCEEASTSSDITACAAGNVCPEGSSLSSVSSCPTGTYDGNSGGLTTIDECLNCTVGHYCDQEGMTTADLAECTAGTHQNQTGLSSCETCEAGWYCPGTGNVQATKCGAGYWSDAGASACNDCEAGYYCESETETVHSMLSRPCEAGTYCDANTMVAPDRLTDACPIGSYCPEAVSAPIACPAGTWGYRDGLASVDECSNCEAGNYCVGGSTAPQTCDAGCFCPEGSSTSCPFSCPAGMYRPIPGGRYLSDACSMCPPGTYCPSEGSTTNTTCPTASYCPRGSIHPEECPAGTYMNTTGSKRVDDCTECDPGWFCEAGSENPTGLCQEGFFCSGGADSAAPMREGAGGDICPKGHYCPAGTAVPISCPAGTYNEWQGATQESDCVECPPGMFCMGTSNQAPDGQCHDGFFCATGSTAATPRDELTPPGSVSSEGDWNYHFCVPGKYNDEFGQQHCKGCPEGTYCPYFNMTWPMPCPQGYYCGVNMTEDIPPCPRGTYGASDSLVAESNCTVCPAGHFCANAGLNSTSGLCNAGFYCPSGSVDAYGRDALCPDHVANRSNPCPRGHYCPMGSFEGTPCPVGSYSNMTRATSVDDCILCDVGWYCDSEGLTEPSGECAAGFYCLRNVSSSRPETGVAGDEGTLQTGGDVCPAGFYCPVGTFSPVPCPEGTYSNRTRLNSSDVCTLCAPSLYCDEGSPGITCPEGHYCPEGTNSSVPKCPMGTYLPYEGAVAEDECLPCPGGHYCPPGTGSSPPICAAGFYCNMSVAIESPDVSVSGDATVGGVCPQGSYCPANTTDPIPCPIGTFGNASFAKEVSDCVACEPGMYCETEGLLAPTDFCQAGYFCPEGSTNATSVPSPRGYFSSAGAQVATACPQGTFNGAVAQPSCTVCPPGFFCPDTAMETPTECPAGYFCPIATTSNTQPCPPGTFSNQTGLQNSSQCTNCTEGFYCPGNDGATTVSGPCEAGYSCSTGSVDKYGHSAVEVASDCDDDGDDGGDGFGLELHECSAGLFCQSGGSGLPCPVGTYSANTGLRYISECTLCDPGMFCNATGLTAPSGPCDAGYQCLRGSQSATPVGPFVDATTCVDDGYSVCVQQWLSDTSAAAEDISSAERESACAVQLLGLDPDVDGAADCHCECEFALQDLEVLVGGAPCPLGYYCPSGTLDPTPCPPGTFGDHEGLSAASECSQCPAGYYCDYYGHTALTYELNVCPAGHFCPNGTALPSPCEPGTFNPSNGSQTSADCRSCEAGKYCIGGEATVTGPCSSGFYCTGGAWKSTPLDGDTGDICWEGWQCPAGAVIPTPCESGFFCSAEFAGKLYFASFVRVYVQC